MTNTMNNHQIPVDNVDKHKIEHKNEDVDDYEDDYDDYEDEYEYRDEDDELDHSEYDPNWVWNDNLRLIKSFISSLVVTFFLYIFTTPNNFVSSFVDKNLLSHIPIETQNYIAMTVLIILFLIGFIVQCNMICNGYPVC